MIINYTEKSMILPMSVIIFLSASKNIVFCRNDVQAIDFLRKGSYAPAVNIISSDNVISNKLLIFPENILRRPLNIKYSRLNRLETEDGDLVKRLNTNCKVVITYEL